MPSGPSTGVPDVIVCAAVSLFSQVTSPPISIVTVLGMKQPSAVCSQPGTDDPGALFVWLPYFSFIHIIKKMV